MDAESRREQLASVRDKLTYGAIGVIVSVLLGFAAVVVIRASPEPRVSKPDEDELSGVSLTWIEGDAATDRIEGELKLVVPENGVLVRFGEPLTISLDKLGTKGQPIRVQLATPIVAPVVESRVVIQQVPANDGVVIRGPNGPTIQSADYTLLFKPFRPLAEGSAGMALGDLHLRWIEKFVEDIAACGEVRVNVSGSASDTEFVDPDGSNAWMSLRETLRKEGVAMDNIMNCGLANARAIGVLEALGSIGDKPHQGDRFRIDEESDSKTWSWRKLRDSRNDLVEMAKSAPSGNGKRPQAIFNHLRSMCGDYGVEGDVGQITLKFTSRSCESADACPVSDEDGCESGHTCLFNSGRDNEVDRNVRLDLTTEGDKVGSCWVGGELTVQETDP